MKLIITAVIAALAMTGCSDEIAQDIRVYNCNSYRIDLETLRSNKAYCDARDCDPDRSRHINAAISSNEQRVEIYCKLDDRMERTAFSQRLLGLKDQYVQRCKAGGYVLGNEGCIP